MVRDTKAWQRTTAAVSAILMAIVFGVSGGWKVLDPFRAGELLEQAKVPAGLGHAGASALGTLELFTALLLLLPQFRRWGGLLASGLMIFFMAWIGYYYASLVGQECSCFPIIKRTIGPGFFVGDGVMLLLSIAAFIWSPPIRARVSLRVPAVLLAGVIALAGVGFARQAYFTANASVPVPIVVDNKPENLNHGKVFLFFFDPSCEYCEATSKFMSTLNWGDTRIVAIPTVNPQWAASFLHDTHLKAGTSLDLDKLRKAFTFGDPPFGVALEDGKVLATFTQKQLAPPVPEPELKQLAFIH